MPMRRGKLLLISATVTVIVSVPLGVAWLVQHNLEAARDCYLQEQVAEMIIEHMERNRGAWPQDWEELSEAYEICQAGPRGSWSTFEEIQELCTVDFSVNPGDLIQSTVPEGKPPFQVVRLVSGKSRHWSGGEPNQLIYRYLKAAAERSEDYEYPAKPILSERPSRRTLLEKGATWELNRAGHVVRVHMGSHQTSPRFNDFDLRHVAELRELKELILDWSNITDAGLQHLSGLKKLRTLYLSSTRISDDGLSQLANLVALETLTLASCDITDIGMVHLQQLPSLKLLNLNGTKIGDRSIPEICNIATLKDIQIGDTRVTSDGVKKLKNAFPNARIYHTTKKPGQ